MIRDVAEEDAGEYTVLARIREHGLLQNLTLTLVVNGEEHNLPTHTRTHTVCLWDQRGDVVVTGIVSLYGRGLV